MTRLIPIAFAVLAVACGPKQFGSLCDEIPAPEACQTPCDPSPGAPVECPSGYYCAADGHCDAQCTAAGGQCGSGYVCTSDGRCVDDGTLPEPVPDANCPAINFTPMPVTPSIGLVLDQSGSMYTNNLGGVTRYRAMRDALVGTTGVVTALESKAYFGSLLYSCINNNNTLDITSVPRALNNAAGVRTHIDSKLNSQGGNTPTHTAINQMVQSFAQNPPPANSPPVIVLATDGLPNQCMGNGGESATVTAARDAYNAGIPVYVLAINQNSNHFQQVANAGQGHMAGQPNVTYYPVTSAAQLQQAFETIISGVISCDLSLTATIDEGQAQAGTVTVNGTPLNYGSDWTLVNGNIVRLVGAACDAFKASANPTVNASFPCGAIIF